MSEITEKAILGAGSYVALIIMVTFAMAGSPWYLVFPVGILNGFGFAFVLKWVISISGGLYQAFGLLYEMHVNSPSERDAYMMDAYLAYIYDHTKDMSDMRKGVS